MIHYTEVDHINMVEEVEAFFDHIVKERKINFHPDNNFEDCINIETHDRKAHSLDWMLEEVA